MRYKIRVTDTETGEIKTSECAHNAVCNIMTGSAFMESFFVSKDGTLQVTFKGVDPDHHFGGSGEQ